MSIKGLGSKIFFFEQLLDDLKLEGMGKFFGFLALGFWVLAGLKFSHFLFL